MNKITEYLGDYVLPCGFLILLIGLYIHPSRNGYKTIAYITFFLPSILLMFSLGWKGIKDYLSVETVLFYSVIFYLALSSLWGGGDVAVYFKRCLMILVAGFSINYLILNKMNKVIAVFLVGLFIVSGVSLFWALDSYIFTDGVKFSSRFLSGSACSVGIYKEGMCGGFYNPLLFGHVQGFWCVIALVLLYESKFNNKTMFCVFLSFLTLLLLLFLAQSRTTILAVAAIGVSLISMKFYMEKRLHIYGTVTILIFMVFIFLFSDSLLQRGLSYRLYIWSESWQLIKQDFIWGSGLGHYVQIKIPSSGKYWNDTHNLFLALWYYGGLVSFSLFILLSFFILNNIRLNKTYSAWVVSMIIYLMIESMTDGGGLIARPNEHWFSWVIPSLFLMSFSRIKSKSVED